MDVTWTEVRELLGYLAHQRREARAATERRHPGFAAMRADQQLRVLVLDGWLQGVPPAPDTLSLVVAEQTRQGRQSHAADR
jgi:hypothetical protein